MASTKAQTQTLIQVPSLFSIVEPGIYRSASPTASQVPFLATLRLKTIISLTPENPIKLFLSLTRSTGIDFLHLGLTLWRPIMDWKPISDELVKASLEVLLDVRNHPLLLIDPLGIHQTGCVVGCLRVMMGWNFASILVEYRAHSGPTKHRYSDEQYIELFDPDLINLPLAEYLPAWFKSAEDEDEDGNGDGDGDDDKETETTAMRTGDGVIPGQGQSTESVVDGFESGRYPNGALTGVG